MPNKFTIHITNPNSKSFLYLTNTLYSKIEQSHVSQPQKNHLLNCYIIKKNDTIVGRFAMYNNPDILYKNKPTLQIGSYECVDDLEVSNALFTFVKNLAKKHKIKYIVGPIEGATWFNYRFSIQLNQPTFFTEMIHKPYYVEQFSESGFNVLKTYSSTIDNNIKVDENRLIKFASKFANEELSIRHIKISKFDHELVKIGEFCNQTFRNNFLFTPLSVVDFVNKYKQLKNYIVPELFFIVEDKLNNIQAFMFCIPNYLDVNKQSIIVKSMATLPERHLAGLQIYLGELMYKNALKLGFSKAIHAYMIDGNMSKGLSKKFNTEMYQTHQLFLLEV